MIKIDLITGFLGSGKTTFLKQYAKYLMAQGKNIGILENDFRRMRQRDTPQTVPHETDLDGHERLRPHSRGTVGDLRCG